MPVADTSTGAQLHYVEYNPQAEGAPIIAIHGLMGTAESHLGHVMRWLADQGYRVIGLTRRGYGESKPKPRDYPLNFYHRDAEDVIAFMDALNLPEAHLMGYSDGGETVMVAAGLAPDRIASMMSWGSVGFFGEELRPIFQRTMGLQLDEAEKALHGFTDAQVEKMARAWVRSLTTMLDAGGDVSLGKASEITAPVLVMLGRGDTLNPEKFGQKFVDATPNGRLVMFDCGHPVHDEKTEEFYQVVGDFLKNID